MSMVKQLLHTYKVIIEALPDLNVHGKKITKYLGINKEQLEGTK